MAMGGLCYRDLTQLGFTCRNRYPLAVSYLHMWETCDIAKCSIYWCSKGWHKFHAPDPAPGSSAGGPKAQETQGYRHDHIVGTPGLLPESCLGLRLCL